MYNPQEIEKKWQDFWEKNKNFFLDKTKFNYFFKIINWLKIQIKLNFKTTKTTKFKKYEIYWIHFWENIWTEFNKKRPWIIFKSNKYIRWKDIIVIPITSNKNWKKYWKLDVFLEKSQINNLKQNSVIKTEHLKSVSKMRIWSYIWKLDEKYYDILDNKINKLLLK